MADITVDDYITGQPGHYHDGLNRMRAFIQGNVPAGTQEKISYMVPCYKYLYSLVGFGVTKKHISFYTMSPKLLTTLKEELKGIDYSGSTLHFALDGPFPEPLLEKIIRLRIHENEARAIAKNK